MGALPEVLVNGVVAVPHTRDVRASGVRVGRGLLLLRRSGSRVIVVIATVRVGVAREGLAFRRLGQFRVTGPGLSKDVLEVVGVDRDLES